MSAATALTAPEPQQVDQREHWTPTDYREEGRRAFDRNRADGSERLMPHHRERFADSYMMIACPLAKRKAAVAAMKAEFGA